MQVSAITQHQKNDNRFAVYIDGAYSLSLSGDSLLSSGLYPGKTLTKYDIASLKKHTATDRLMGQVYRYVSLRNRSQWEVEQYLRRKQASPQTTPKILDNLTRLGLVDDRRYAEAYIHDHQLLRPTSLRKLRLELQKKHISDTIINELLNDSQSTETTALQAVIQRKRRQPKYQDDLKLMQYLARQGFGYADIKQALREFKP